MAMPIAQTPAPTSLLASGGDGGGAGDADGEDWALALVLGVMLGVLLLGESVSVTPASPPLTAQSCAYVFVSPLRPPPGG